MWLQDFVYSCRNQQGGIGEGINKHINGTRITPQKMELVIKIFLFPKITVLDSFTRKYHCLQSSLPYPKHLKGSDKASHSCYKLRTMWYNCTLICITGKDSTGKESLGNLIYAHRCKHKIKPNRIGQN